MVKHGHLLRYETFSLTYIPKPKKYTPDFQLDNGIILEGKGYFDSEDRSKMLRIKEQHPDLDIRFVFARPENKIAKKSKTTYAKWAEDHGFKWCGPDIPKDWFNK